MTPEEIDAIETRWLGGGVIGYAQKIKTAAEDIDKLIAHSKKLALQNEWLKDEVSSVQKIGLENVQQLAQAVNEAKELRATVDHLHTILGRKEYELQELREKLAPFLTQEEK